MHHRTSDPVERAYRWKTIAALGIAAYGLLVYGAISLDGWLKERRKKRDNASGKSASEK